MGKPSDLVQGTLDLLILKTLSIEARHGWAIAKRIQLLSGEVLQVQQGSLYPALHRLEQQGLRFSGLSPDGVLPEIVEYEDHPWFIGVQFHPELKSRPFEPHPLFASFIQAAVVQSRLV